MSSILIPSYCALLSLSLSLHTPPHTVVFVGAIAPRQAAWNWSLQRVLDYQRDTATRKLGDTGEGGGKNISERRGKEGGTSAEESAWVWVEDEVIRQGREGG